MTVKLAKFFSSSVSATTATSMAAAPANVSGGYYQPQPSQQQHQQQQQYADQEPHYNSYLDDDDDSMSVYSNGASIMTSRDHPYNNSQRPLLAERKPQLLNKKKMNAIINQPQRQQQQPKQRQHQHQLQLQQQQQQPPQKPQPPQQHQPLPQKPYISPYVQRQKRDSAKGLHGFNDFNDILSQQYNEHLQCSPHIGYPYGSPPSPTARSNDFVFDTASAPSDGSSGSGRGSASEPAAPTFRYHYAPGAAIADYSYCDGNAVAHNGSAGGAPTTTTLHYMGAPSRFEDDFCCRRNASFSAKAAASPPPPADTDGGGPFIFGVSHAPQQRTQQQQQRDLCRLPPPPPVVNERNNSYNVGSADTVIDVGGLIDANKYVAVTAPATTTMHSSSDTSSSSRDSSSQKGAKFLLLRKGKSKRNNRDKQSKTASVERQRQKQQQQHQQQHQPTIKCVVVGDGAVGKTNLILSYLENRFNAEHVPTASDIYNADVMVNDSPVQFTICDTAGQDTLDQLRELCYPDSDVFLLCFSVARPETFHAIKTKWAPKFSKTKAALILVGTQADLRTNTNVLSKLQISGEKPISYADAWDLATTIGAKYIETSSVTQDKVKEVFDTAIWEGLAPTTLPPTPAAPLWKKLLCLA